MDRINWNLVRPEKNSKKLGDHCCGIDSKSAVKLTVKHSETYSERALQNPAGMNIENHQIK